MERDLTIFGNSGISAISTHTLTWSVTFKPYFGNNKNRISTHTLTWSVTASSSIWSRQTFDFNSHAHVERDALFVLEGFSMFLNFNSHAHVERDRLMNGRNYSPLYFNSHAHVERDDFNGIYGKGTEISTHTLTWSVTYKGF